MGAGAAGGATARYVFGFYCFSLKLDFKQLRLKDAPRVLVCFNVLVVHNLLLKLPFFACCSTIVYNMTESDGVSVSPVTSLYIYEFSSSELVTKRLMLVYTYFVFAQDCFASSFLK